MRILVKFPTRERPAQFMASLRALIDRAANPDALTILISIDDNDHSMTAPHVLSAMTEIPNSIISTGISQNKIDAVNRDINLLQDKYLNWDILVQPSDDMHCMQEGWDNIIIRDMYATFPDTDGVLWYWDGDKQTRNNLNTMCILGRKYYERFGYIYHPSYRSLWADNEFTEVARRLDRLFYSEQVLFKHVHFSNTPGLKPDALMKHTQSFFYEDEANYKRREAINFGL